MLQIPGSTVYMGCVGTDEYADKMTEVCSNDGVKVGPLAVGLCACCGRSTKGLLHSHGV